MSDKRTRANHYAQAVMQAMVERWQGALGEAAQALSTNSSLAAVVNDSNASLDDKLGAFDNALSADIPVEARNLLKLLVQEDDLGLLADVSSAIAELAVGQKAPTKAEVTSAVELSDAERENLQQSLIAEHGEDITFSFHVDSSLLGGLRVRVGDRLIDNSVASRLSTPRESLTSVVR